MLKTYCHALLNIPQKKAYKHLLGWLLDVVKPLRTLRKLREPYFSVTYGLYPQDLVEFWGLQP